MRKDLHIFLTVCVFALLLLASCRPELDYVTDSFRSSQAQLSQSGETITVLFDANAGSASLDLLSSGDWTAEFVNGRAYWCTLSQSEGKKGVATLTFTVQANGEYDERSASVIFSTRDLRRTVVVVQKQRDALLLSSDRVDVPAEGGMFSIQVSSNIDFTHSVSSEAGGWIHSIGTKGLQQSVVTFSVDANPSLERRIGVITFKGASGEEPVNVYQKGEIPTIVVSEATVNLPAGEGTFQVEVASNLDVSYEISDDCSWLQEVRTKTVSTRTYTFAYTRNHSRELRTCAIVFRNEAFEKAETVQVEQPPAEILKAPSQVFVPSTGETVALLTAGEVEDFGQFRFEADWPEAVSVTPGEEGNRFLVRIDPNPTPFVRRTACSVYRPGFDEPDRLEFVQFGRKPSFSYETTLQEVTVPVFQGLDETALVIWGDGSYETYAEGLTHTYAAPGIHTIRIEGTSLPFFLIPAPQNGALYDFSQLNDGREETI